MARSHPLTVAAVVLLALLAGAACSGDDPSAREPSSPSPDPAPCAWATRGDRETNNIAYPDAAATYWALTFDLAAGEVLEVAGRFPSARYSSFITYGPYGGEVDVLTDADIAPEDGDTNPFDGSAAAEPGGDDDEHRYVISVGGEEVEDRENLVGATAAPGSNAAQRVEDAAAEDQAEGATPSDPGSENLLGTGAGEGTPGVLMYRVYVPEPADDLTGGVGLPEVTVVGADGTRTAIDTCAEPGPNPRAVELTEAYGPPTDRPAPPEPVFVRPEAGAANLFPNPDNVYIATIAEHRPGHVIALRATSPTFPDPSQGRPVGTGEQVRYWSICTNEYRKPYPVSSCVVDRDVLVDDEGRYTLVISTPDERPANATAQEGVTWLDWGSTEVDNLLLLRHMLADPSFAESAIDLEPGAVAMGGMGPYAPEAVYCPVELVESGGVDACFA